MMMGQFYTLFQAEVVSLARVHAPASLRRTTILSTCSAPRLESQDSSRTIVAILMVSPIRGATVTQCSIATGPRPALARSSSLEGTRLRLCLHHPVRTAGGAWGCVCGGVSLRVHLRVTRAGSCIRDSRYRNRKWVGNAMCRMGEGYALGLS